MAGAPREGRVSTIRRRIAVITPDALGAVMAGPAIRAWHIAQTLSEEHDVVLVSTSAVGPIAPVPVSASSGAFRVELAGDAELQRLERWADVLVVQGWAMARRPFLVNSDRVVVVDAYDPLHLEQLEHGRDRDEDGRRGAVFEAAAVLNEQLLRADFILCASEQQRSFWLGALASLGRVNPATYDDDVALRRLLAIVPFGLSAERPQQSQHAIKGVMSGIAPDDHVVLWGGGIYNWFDPLTLLRAVDRLRHDDPRVRLVFLGVRHPNPDLPEMQMAAATRQLAAELELTDRFVFFNESWVPYDERHNHLLDADVGVSTHLDHLETEFAFRTRVIDYLWARLPVVVTRGDALAELVETRGLGAAVDPGDVDGLAAALGRVLSDSAFRSACVANVDEVVSELTWPRVLRPLVEFCRDPRPAPDRVQPAQAALLRRGPAVGVPPISGVRGALHLARSHVREGGVPLLARRLWSRARRLGRRNGSR
jgi:glycosyltransferase involved in cell wall biosynthesis